MQKSIIERVFPRANRPLLPQYDEPRFPYHDQDDETGSGRVPERIRLSSNVSRTSTSHSSRRGSAETAQSRSNQRLQSAPLSASLVHHDDPFLAVDRAAANLQKAIQALLDFQGEALNHRHQTDHDEAASQRSASPNLSRTTYSSSTPRKESFAAGATPVRQPKEKKPTLRGARRGLARSMQEFAALKDQEVRITDNETTNRRKALERISDLETKREAVQYEIRVLQERANGNEAGGLRSEAQTVEQEIHELETRLVELRLRHRYLVDRATQIENTTASEMSSYEGTLKLVDEETQSFLRRPPVKQSLKPRSLAEQQQSHDMYALRSERRTLELAKEQWTREVELLEAHKTSTERERAALVEGATVWEEITKRLDEYEHGLVMIMKTNSTDAASEIVANMSGMIQYLQEKWSFAESKDWNLLICAIGAEIEAFRQARALLAPNDPFPVPASPKHQQPGTINGPLTKQANDGDDDDVPHADLLSTPSPGFTSVQPSSTHPDMVNHNHDSVSNSNESLKATLRDFPPSSMTTSKTHSRVTSAGINKAPLARKPTQYSESEDDDPGPDFLISR